MFAFFPTFGTAAERTCGIFPSSFLFQYMNLTIYEIGPDNLLLFYLLKYEGQVNNLVKKTVHKSGF